MIAPGPKEPVSLLTWLEHYELTHTLRDTTLQMYRNSIRAASSFAGMQLTTANISDKVLNSILQLMDSRGRSIAYIRSLRSAVMTIWRDAADEGLCAPPRKIRKVRDVYRRPEIWSPEQVAKLSIAPRAFKSEFNTLALSRAMYWETLILVAWDTGLRRLDLHRLTLGDIKPDFTWTQNKTGKAVRVRLRESTLELIKQWDRDDGEPLWPLWASDNSFRQDWHRIVGFARVPYGPFKRIRKSAGTAAEIDHPGSGHYMLGNTRAVFEASYLDAMQVETPQPPELCRRVQTPARQVPQNARAVGEVPSCGQDRNAGKEKPRQSQKEEKCPEWAFRAWKNS